MEGLLSEFCRPLAHAQNAIAALGYFCLPPHNGKLAAPVLILKIALRATPVKAQCGQCVFRSSEGGGRRADIDGTSRPGWPFSLRGWQVMYIAEAIPTVGIGVITFFVLTDRPDQAKFVTAEESRWLVTTIAAERRATEPSKSTRSCPTPESLSTVNWLILGASATLSNQTGHDA